MLDNNSYTDEHVRKLLNRPAQYTIIPISTEHVLKASRLDGPMAKLNLYLMFFGVLSNLACIWVLCRKTMLMKRFNFYLLILALVDLVFCSILLTNYIVHNLFKHRALYDLSSLTCYGTDYIHYTLDACSVYLTLILSIDRLYAIIRPMRVKNFFIYQYPRRVVLIGFLVIFVFHLPHIIYNQRTFIEPPDLSSTTTTTSTFSTTTRARLAKYKNMLQDDSQPRPDLPSQQMGDYDDDENDYDSDQDFQTYSYSSSQAKQRIVKARHTKSHCHHVKSYFNKDKHHEKALATYISLPLVFNFFPSTIILILNILLIFFMKEYIKFNASPIGSASGLRRHSGTVQTVQKQLPASSQLSETNQSYCYVIIIMAAWIMFANTPYYSLMAYDWFLVLKTTSIKTNMHISVQTLSSFLFNLAHCINFVIYAIFHRTFRYEVRRMICSIWNANAKLEPILLEEASDEMNARNNSNGSIKTLCDQSILPQDTAENCILLGTLNLKCDDEKETKTVDKKKESTSKKLEKDAKKQKGDRDDL